MLKPLMIGSAMLIAIPAFAQTGLHTSAPGTNTNTNTVTGQTGLPNSQTSTQWGTTPDSSSSTGLSTGTRTYATPTVGAHMTGTTGVTTGTTAGSWSNGAASNYTGVGGPEADMSMRAATAAHAYPRCSRTLRDNCTQIGPRRR